MARDVYTQLRDRILEGEYAPDEILSQVQVARDLGVSRGPVREAFSRLHQQGLITAEANQRSRIAAFDPDALDALFGLRVVTEAFGARITCAAATPTLVAQLRGLLGVLDETDAASPDWRAANRAFHAAVVGGAGDIVRSQTEALQERSEPYFRLYAGYYPIAAVEHESVVEAFEAVDPSLAMRRHGRHVAHSGWAVLARMVPEYEPLSLRTALRMVGVDEPDPEC